MYRTKEYVERSWDEIKTEIDLVSAEYPETRRIFLADGDALNLPAEGMIQILNYLRAKFCKVERISCYAMPKNLLQKKESDLVAIRKAGLDMLYVGIESGNNAVLKKVTKGATSKGIVQACKKAMDTSYTLSCMVILGLGGRTYSKEHILDTAKILSEIAPDYAAALTLYLEEGVQDEFMTKFGEPFVFLEDYEILDELEKLISNFNPGRPVIFRANHASNVYSFGGTMPADREKILARISDLKRKPEMLKPKFLRRF